MSSVGPGESTLGWESSSSEPSSFCQIYEYSLTVQRIRKGISPEGDTVQNRIRVINDIGTDIGWLNKQTHEFAVWPKNVERPPFEMELGNERAVNPITETKIGSRAYAQRAQ